MRLRARARARDGPAGTESPARECRVVSRPHAVRQLHRVFQPVETFPGRRQRYAQVVQLRQVVARADTEPGPAAGQYVERCHRFHEQRGRTQRDRRDHRAEPHTFSPRGQMGERRERLQHRLRPFRSRFGLLHVVGNEDRVDATSVGGLREGVEVRGDGVGGRPREVRDRDAGAHVTSAYPRASTATRPPEFARPRPRQQLLGGPRGKEPACLM